MNYTCNQCGESFTSYNKNPQFCSHECKVESQCAPVDIERIRILYAAGKTQQEIAASLGVSQKAVFGAMRRHGIKARVAAKRDQWGSANHMWKGDGASKCALHRRLYSRYGKPKKCEVCGTESAKNYDYANLSGEYEALSDYIPMCRSCHWKFDRKHLNFQGGEKCRSD